jgi:hypothetical protein
LKATDLLNSKEIANPLTTGTNLLCECLPAAVLTATEKAILNFKEIPTLRIGTNLGIKKVERVIMQTVMNQIVPMSAMDAKEITAQKEALGKEAGKKRDASINTEAATEAMKDPMPDQKKDKKVMDGILANGPTNTCIIPIAMKNIDMKEGPEKKRAAEKDR